MVLSGAGFSNKMAYALGLDAKVAKATDLPTLGKMPLAGVYHQTLAFKRNLAATDLSYQTQFGTDLGNWTPLSTFSGGAWSPSNIVTEAPAGNPNLNDVQVRDSVALGSGGKRFLRLVITH